MHNGIIENYLKLKTMLEVKGYHFISETDTEVVAHLLDYYYKGDPIEAIRRMMHRVEGSYALGIIFKEHPDRLFAVRKDSPLIAGQYASGNLIASDVPAILKYTRDVYFMQNEEIVCLEAERLTFCNIDGDEIPKESISIGWDVSAAEKAGYEHFMLKEIYEQPKAVLDTLSPRIQNGKIEIDELGMTEDEIRAIRKICIVACGSAYHAGMSAKYVLEDLARIPVEADNVMYTWAGPEISVATTKAYSTQLIAAYLLAMKFAQVRGMVSDQELSEMLCALQKLPKQIELLLEHKERMQKFANRYIAAKDIFFIGRGIDYAISMEGSLKLKEISYIHSEAYAAGEMKHGTISLIEEGTLVAAVLTQEALYKKMISNMVEVKTRGAFLLAVTNEGNTEAEKAADYVIYIPKTHRCFTNSLAVIPLQLFGYYVALGKGCDVDKPRNLAKSVTVE